MNPFEILRIIAQILLLIAEGMSESQAIAAVARTTGRTFSEISRVFK